MRKMKDSGIEWIGLIPEDWEIKRIKNLIETFTKGSGITKEEVFLDGDTPCVRYGEIYTKFNISFKECFSHTKKEILPSLRYFKYGDLLCAGTGELVDEIGKTIVYLGKDKCLAGGDIIILSHSQNQDPKFLSYALNSHYIQAQRSCGKSKLKVVHISATEIGNSIIVVPSYQEQQSIATYLDTKCSEIDTIVRETEQTIEEYKKLKQSLITEVVTGKKRVADDGLSLSDEPREMKDSGVEWIGEVPREWELRPFRHILKERSEKNNPIQSEERLSLSIELGVTLYSEKTTNLDRFKDDFTQYKLAHEGDLVMNSMNMIVGASGVSKYFGCVSPVYYTYYDELEDHTTAKYCEYIFRSKTMLRVLYSLGKGIYAIERGDDKVNTCRLKVSKEDLKSIIIPSPTEKEQRNIVNFLNSKCSEIDKLILDKQRLLEELENYKKSLIYECVTGKREIN